MLKINISDEIKKEIERKHLKYFKEYVKNKFKDGCNLKTEILNISEDSVLGSPKNLKKILKILKALAIGNPEDIINDLEKGKFKFLNAEKDKFKCFSDEYKNFRSSDKEWNLVELIKKLEIKICCYCGKDYIHTVEKKDSKEITEATFDHFYPKKKYPFLALNLYNLIPCCHKCNSTYKCSSTKEILNPYYEEWGSDVKFTTKINDFDIGFLLNPERNDKFDIKIKNYKQDDSYEKVENEISDVLYLKKRYSQYKDVVRSLIKKKIYYNDSYQKELKNYGIFGSGELGQMLISEDMYDKNEPLSKFKKDIWDELSD